MKLEDYIPEEDRERLRTDHNIDIQSKLDAGRFSDIFSATDDRIVVKVIDTDFTLIYKSVGKIQEQILNKYHILRICGLHPNIVFYYINDFYLSSDLRRLYLPMERPDCSLKDW